MPVSKRKAASLQKNIHALTGPIITCDKKMFFGFYHFLIMLLKTDTEFPRFIFIFKLLFKI